MAHEPDITLAEARAIVDRALAKARALHQAGAFVLVDAGGNVVTVSRIGEGPPSSVWVSRAKAYVSSVQRAPSARSATNWRDNPAVFSAFQRLMRDDIFPGPGAMPIRKGDRVVGALSTGGGLGPWTEIPGVDPSELMVDGAPANAEDMIIADALQIPYSNQHPDVQRLVGPRVTERIDDLPHCLAGARRYADGAIEYAKTKGLRAGIVVVDEMGQPVQMDRMDGAPPQSIDMAEAKALTALNFQRPTSEVDRRFSVDRLAQIRAIVHYHVLAAGGGLPITQDGDVVGAIGVSGAGNDETNEEIARGAIKAT